MITIFTPSFADASNTNAQNLTVKEIVARLPPERFRVRIFFDSEPDARIAARPNTELMRFRKYGNTALALGRCLLPPPDIYFFPREGPLDGAWLFLRRHLRLRTALVTYVVFALDRTEPSAMLARTIREADVVVGNSEYVAGAVARRFEREVATIHSGIRREIFFPASGGVRSAGGGLTVLYAGSFQSRKRVDRVIREAAKWPNVRFRLAGRGEEEGACRALVEQLGCRNVEFLGHLPSVALGDAMRQADVFLFPSVLEGHPQVLGQAAGCGLPCVAMDVYRPDYVVNGVTGFLVRSETELSEKLEVLLTRPDLRQTMAAAALELSLNFDWDRVVERWAQVFASAAGQGTAS